MKLTWRQKLEKWLVNGQSVALVGDRGFERADVWIINYEQLAKYHVQLRGRRLDLLIADESHYLKNPKSQRSKLVRALGPLARRRVLLTGTPVLNKPAELWAQLNLIDPVQWPKFFPFALRYCNAYRNQFGWDFSGASNLQELKLRLRVSCMLRRRKVDVLSQLPEITRAMIPLGGCVSADGQLDQVTREIASEMKMSVEELISSRRDIDPKDISFSCAARARAILGTMKLSPALEFICEESQGDPESKFVIFAHHLAVLHGLAEGLPGALLVTGETPLSERQCAIDRFQTDTAAKYFVASIMAMSLGVTLTAASRVVSQKRRGRRLSSNKPKVVAFA
jgi:SWI/SNF-related matrix-associated actin-dependent regulator of chromatin subfamily A-like protein 1